MTRATKAQIMAVLGKAVATISRDQRTIKALRDKVQRQAAQIEQYQQANEGLSLSLLGRQLPTVWTFEFPEQDE